MAEIRYSIPGLEPGLHRIACDDKVSRVFFSSKLTKDLARKYYTATAFFSLNGDEEDYQKLLASYGVTRFYSVRQNNPDIEVIMRKCSAMYSRRFVRCIIIDELSNLRIKGFTGDREAEKLEIRRRLNSLAKALNIKIFLLYPKSEMTELAESEIDVLEEDIISQLAAES